MQVSAVYCEQNKRQWNLWSSSFCFILIDCSAKLYTKSIPDNETELPSPEDLSGYVLVKVKLMLMTLKTFQQQSFNLRLFLIIKSIEENAYLWLQVIKWPQGTGYLKSQWPFESRHQPGRFMATNKFLTGDGYLKFPNLNCRFYICISFLGKEVESGSARGGCCPRRNFQRRRVWWGRIEQIAEHFRAKRFISQPPAGILPFSTCCDQPDDPVVGLGGERRRWKQQ